MGQNFVHHQDVPDIVIRLGNSWYFRKLVAEKRWSQLEVQLYFETVLLRTKQTQNACTQQTPNVLKWPMRFCQRERAMRFFPTR